MADGMEEVAAALEEAASVAAAPDDAAPVEAAPEGAAPEAAAPTTRDAAAVAAEPAPATAEFDASQFADEETFEAALLAHARGQEAPLKWNAWQRVAYKIAPFYPGSAPKGFYAPEPRRGSE